MDAPDTKDPHAGLKAGETEARRLMAIGRLGTAIYVGVVLVYFLCKWDNFAQMKPNEVGDFLAGVAGPLALFWLVLGYLQQGRELQQNTAALLLQAKEMQQAAEQARQLVAVTREELLFAQSLHAQEEARSIAAERPELQYVRVQGTAPGHVAPSGRMVGRYVFTVVFRNIGGDALDVHAEAEASSSVKVDSRSIGHVARLGDHFVEIELIFGDPRMFPGISFDLLYKDRFHTLWSTNWEVVRDPKLPKPSLAVHRRNAACLGPVQDEGITE